AADVVGLADLLQVDEVDVGHELLLPLRCPVEGNRGPSRRAAPRPDAGGPQRDDSYARQALARSQLASLRAGGETRPVGGVEDQDGAVPVLRVADGDATAEFR